MIRSGEAKKASILSAIISRMCRRAPYAYDYLIYSKNMRARVRREKTEEEAGREEGGWGGADTLGGVNRDSQCYLNDPLV